MIDLYARALVINRGAAGGVPPLPAGSRSNPVRTMATARTSSGGGEVEAGTRLVSLPRRANAAATEQGSDEATELTRTKRKRLQGTCPDLKATLLEQCKEARSLRSNQLSKDVSAVVIHVYLSLRLLDVEARMRRGHPVHRDPQYYRAMTCKLTGVSDKLFMRVMKAWMSPISFGHGPSRVVFSPPAKRAARGKVVKRIKDEAVALEIVRASVDDARQHHRTWSTAEALLCIDAAGHLDPPLPVGAHVKTRAFLTAREVVRKFLRRNGFSSSEDATHVMAETETVVSERALYLDEMLRNRTAPAGQRLRVVYLGESSIHGRSPKSARTCFIGAIVGENMNKAPGDAPVASDLACWFDPAYWMFDNGKGFTSEVFEGWMRVVAKELHEAFGKCLIVMDNVVYRKRKVENALLKGGRKAELFAELQRLGLTQPGETEATVLKATVRARYDAYVSTCRTVVEKIADKYGHRLLFTPSYHSCLLPIELIWAIAKGKVANRHGPATATTRMEGVSTQLLKAFSEVMPHQVQGCIQKTEAYEAKLRARLRRADEADDGVRGDDAAESMAVEAHCGLFTSKRLGQNVTTTVVMPGLMTLPRKTRRHGTHPATPSKRQCLPAAVRVSSRTQPWLMFRPWTHWTCCLAPAPRPAHTGHSLPFSWMPVGLPCTVAPGLTHCLPMRPRADTCSGTNVCTVYTSKQQLLCVRWHSRYSSDVGSAVGLGGCGSMRAVCDRR